MKLPSFVRTIRFRLTLWYVSFLMIVVIALLLSLNINVGGAIKVAATPRETSMPSIVQVIPVTPVADPIRHALFRYSIAGAVIALIAGSLGIYFISGRMLQPVARVTSLAKKSSYSNLDERLNYTGPNDELKQLADTFDNMLNRLKKAADSQQQFVQDASHELRTPIAMALTNIEVLEMNAEATVEDYHKLTDVLKLSLDRMNNISNSLQLLSENSHLAVQLEKVNIAKVIDEVVIEAEMEARKQDVTVNWQSPDAASFVLGDTYQLKQVIFNLVSNALKYNLPRGTVNITLHHENQSAVIEIADTGMGIPVADQPYVFDRFFRVDKSRSRERGGSGLGLAIVKKVIEDHRGTVSVDSTLGRGTTFRVELPLYPQD